MFFENNFVISRKKTDTTLLNIVYLELFKNECENKILKYNITSIFRC